MLNLIMNYLSAVITGLICLPKRLVRAFLRFFTKRLFIKSDTSRRIGSFAIAEAKWEVAVSAPDFVHEICMKN